VHLLVKRGAQWDGSMPGTHKVSSWSAPNPSQLHTSLVAAVHMLEEGIDLHPSPANTAVLCWCSCVTHALAVLV
jgi:hypothetical protein